MGKRTCHHCRRKFKEQDFCPYCNTPIPEKLREIAMYGDIRNENPNRGGDKNV